VVDRKIL